LLLVLVGWLFGRFRGLGLGLGRRDSSAWAK